MNKKFLSFLMVLRGSITLLIFFFALNLVSAGFGDDFGYNNLEVPQLPPEINYSELPTVNASEVLITDEGLIDNVVDILGSWITNDLGWITDFFNITYHNKADYQFTSNNFVGSGDFTTTGRITTEDFTFGTPSQDYDFTGRVHMAGIKGQTSSSNAGLEIFSKDGDGTDTNQLIVWNKGTPEDTTNSDGIQFQNSVTKAVLRHFILGTATEKPLSLSSGGNSDQLLLKTDGTLQALLTYSSSISLAPRDLYIDLNGVIGYLGSSRNYKKDIVPANNTEWIYDLPIVDYKYKEDLSNKVRTGGIAEDWELINPDLISYKRNITYETICLDKMDLTSCQRNVISNIETNVPETINYGDPELITSLIREMQLLKQENQMLKDIICKYYPDEWIC